MTQEDKDLLMKDLCARLPYGVKVLIQDTFKYSIVSPERHVLDVSNFSDIFCFKYKKLDTHMKKAMRERPDYIVIKPYLFPLSSITKAQKTEEYELMNSNFYTSTVELPDFYNKNHIDYRGLIPMGLANDATGLNIY